MKDHEKRELVNELTAIAKEFSGTQQLRERIAHCVLPAMEHAQQFADSTQSSAHANLCRAYLELNRKLAAYEAALTDLSKGRLQLPHDKYEYYVTSRSMDVLQGKEYALAAMLQQAQEEERQRCVNIANNMFHAAAQGDEIAEAIRKGE